MLTSSPFVGTPSAYAAGTRALHVTDGALIFMRQESEAWTGVESGGALVGYVHGDTLTVTHASGPGPRAKRTSNSVSVDGQYTTEFCFDLQVRSGGQLYYLGDWHIHRRGSLDPSSKDIRAACALLQGGATFVPYLAMLIFSGGCNGGAAYVYVADGTWHPLRLVLGGRAGWAGVQGF